MRILIISAVVRWQLSLILTISLNVHLIRSMNFIFHYFATTGVNGDKFVAEHPWPKKWNLSVVSLEIKIHYLKNN